jgi:hypothetical protein
VGSGAFRYSDDVAYILGRILEVAAMLTLGVALLVYGFGEQNMNAELGWLLAGSVLFLIGYALERRSGKGE